MTSICTSWVAICYVAISCKNCALLQVSWRHVNLRRPILWLPPWSWCAAGDGECVADNPLQQRHNKRRSSTSLVTPPSLVRSASLSRDFPKRSDELPCCARACTAYLQEASMSCREAIWFRRGNLGTRRHYFQKQGLHYESLWAVALITKFACKFRVSCSRQARRLSNFSQSVAYNCLGSIKHCRDGGCSQWTTA